jgi:hypothetical protein
MNNIDFRMHGATIKNKLRLRVVIATSFKPSPGHYTRTEKINTLYIIRRKISPFTLQYTL